MKSKTWIIIAIIAIVVIVLITGRKSQKTPLINYPTTTRSYDQTIPTTSAPQTQGGTNQVTTSIDADTQSIDALVGGINTSDFSPNSLDGIE
jgi:hypothetical protein